MQGTGRELKGKIKETAGRMTKNRDLEARGAAEKASGKIQRKVGDIKKVVEN